MNAPQHQTLRERIYEEIVRLIVSGELPSGVSIDEKLLTERLQVSRTPFREAIGTLAKEGLIEIKPYRGFFVRSFSRKEIEDLYELRKTLECFAVELAVPQMSDTHIAGFERILDEAVAALRRGDLQTYGTRDREFHETIAELSGSAPLIETLARLALQIQICRAIANESKEFAERAAQERDDILQAFRARDIPRAKALMHAHISDVQQAVLTRFRKEIPAS
ncbi:GntR family transcriptional regulator [Agrobacterium sp. TS43]|jgi:DNA-binding GntR family transcriptional regulator|uniref:GntR family transcriptional regulator n=1 Tax=Agrobacterium TaxID=357 RepID=UPI0003636F04|nr:MULTISPECIES: GntR family transcriptional regulator [Agrobacterium]EPR10945.1 GntR family transcriptional regulator [Agrobacterium radiobacter DSM 30147]KDR86790.1 GntR family transcriptional regulator [Agrobacterium tumefaciens GW4]KVK45702.1 GntR family transcriptional regulator [Agrobacterium sp. LY4]KVK45787.1 GntR family transcriptional regulator [Agrobacterium sp. JL28]KVK59402.1 GntR family transcriptional regulator [Agrobacterium sp. TS45]